MNRNGGDKGAARGLRDNVLKLCRPARRLAESLGLGSRTSGALASSILGRTLINFGHPLSAGQRERINELLGEQVQEEIHYRPQFDMSVDFAEQARALVNSCGLSAEQWQTSHPIRKICHPFQQSAAWYWQRSMDVQGAFREFTVSDPGFRGAVRGCGDPELSVDPRPARTKRSSS